ncbi:AAA family ATPase [Sphingomonas sp.]|uniref:AAA family ATPase n=1 Tax=Sphingomonas sp. TaxID=28214 RepID=UPI002DED2422|nr:AAA family ATPase [Sphingomonas sp.]HEV2567076.1 AAA family ATPase [Sphingomonas sp.]
MTNNALDSIEIADAADEIPWSQAPAEARREQLGKLFVKRDIEERVVAAIDSARRERLILPEAQNVVIIGETGVGKSEIAKRYLAANPEYRDPETGCIVRPVLYVDVRNSSTPKGVAKAMLRQLGLDDTADDDDGKGWGATSVSDLTHCAKKQMVGQQVEVALLDEFHNTVTDNGAVRLNRIAEWVKDFAKSKRRTAAKPDGERNENIVFVLIGTRKVKNIVDPTVNAELASITPYRVEIDRYRYGSVAEKEEFRAFLNDLDYELPFDEDSRLGEPGLADKFHIATFGLLRQLGHIVTKAADLAIEDGSNRIYEHHLHAAVELKRGVLESHLMSEESQGDERRVVSNPFTPPQLPVSEKPSRRRGWKG